MKTILTIFFAITTTYSFSQICPTIERRNNGNGQPNSCSGVNGTPMASNMIGTPYATSFVGFSKTGDIKFQFAGAVSSPPAIKRIWIGSTLSAAVAGPASVPVVMGSYTVVTYCFYNVNLPPAGVYTLEFVNPQTNEVMSLCGFSGSSNQPINPPVITSQPESQTACLDGTATFSVFAQPSNGGSLTYQWRKSGIEISGATSSKYTLGELSMSSAGVYDCRVGETTGTFVISDPATLTVISCDNNVYMNSCGSGPLTNTATNSWNNAWVDFDNDNWEDLFVTEKNENASSKLYKNTLGNFALVNASPLTTSMAKTTGSSWADIDNDGDMDAILVNATGKKSEIYENTGSTFSLLASAGIDGDPQYFHGAAWSDFDNDGFVDLLITNFFETRFHHLYRNNGNKTFTRIFHSPITLESNRSMAPILADYNNDGLTDVFIPNGNNQPNSLFKNLGNFQFEKITTGDIATDAYNSVGACWGDYDNDGWMDLFVANASNQNNNLYKNNGNGTFTRIESSIVISNRGHSHGANFIDLENDGDLDLFVTNDEGPNFLYINDGSGNFSRVMDEAIATDLGMTYGQAWADYNKDGVLDVMISTHSDQPDKLFCGKSNSNHWINIKLEGTVSNAAAIGVRVSVKAGGRWQVRHVNPISGFGSQNSVRQHVGLGASTTIDSIRVEWPSGITQYLTNVNPDVFMTIVEEAANNVTLITFNDSNSNCIKDANESLMPGIMLGINPVAAHTATNQDGTTQVWLRNGTYTVDLENELYWQLVCPASFTINNADEIAYIPLQNAANEVDLAITIGTTAWRRGFKNETVVTYKNKGTSAVENVKINLQYPPEVVIASSSLSVTQTVANTYTITLASLNPGEWGTLFIIDSVTLNSFVGQAVTLTASIESSGDDADLSNNTATEYKEIVGAVDPNDMVVSPRGQGESGLISREQKLTYTIRFENVGTYSAAFVVLRNKLPSNLDLSTFQIVSSSHSYRYVLDSTGLLCVKFPSINLPSSAENETESHGFLTYSLMPAGNVVADDKIINSASITFDYEDAVLTNTVTNTISKDLKIGPHQLIIVPNPASEVVRFTWNKRDGQQGTSRLTRLQCYDQRGVQQLEFKSSNIEAIDISSLEPGLYVLKAIDQSQRLLFGKLIVRK